MTTHLSDAEMRQFAAGTLAAEELLRADDHLSQCSECRGRAATMTGVPRAVDALRVELADVVPHVSDEELPLLIAGRLDEERQTALLRHLRQCDTCSRQVSDLRAWATSSSVGRPRWTTFGLAAAVLLAVLIPVFFWMRSARPDPAMAALPRLAGYDTLGPIEQAQVRDALRAGVASLPDFMGDLVQRRELLMGRSPRETDTFTLTAPVATATKSDQPQFEWRRLNGASEFIVTVFDEQSNIVVRSPALGGNTWRPTQPLSRGRTYVWQVAARLGAETVTAPVAPEPPARFRVVDGRTADALRKIESAQPDSHLVLGILYMGAGIVDEAAREFRRVSVSDPASDVARRSLERLEPTAARF